MTLSATPSAPWTVILIGPEVDLTSEAAEAGDTVAVGEHDESLLPALSPEPTDQPLQHVHLLLTCAQRSTGLFTHASASARRS